MSAWLELLPYPLRHGVDAGGRRPIHRGGRAPVHGARCKEGPNEKLEWLGLGVELPLRNASLAKSLPAPVPTPVPRRHGVLAKSGPELVGRSSTEGSLLQRSRSRQGTQEKRR